MIDSPDAMLKMLEKNGGPAHPTEYSMQDGAVFTCPGITIRDWFAGQAISGGAYMLGISAPTETESDRKLLVSAAYAIADAMLAERKPKP